MLQKSDASDDCAKTFAHWLAMLPCWNLEADRFRAAALAARRGDPLEDGVIDDAEETVNAIRGALARCDALLTAALPGDQHLTPLVNAAAEFDALLESLHGSLDLMADSRRRPQYRRQTLRISRAAEERAPG